MCEELDEKREPFHFLEHTMVHRDGSQSVLECSGMPVYVNP